MTHTQNTCAAHHRPTTTAHKARQNSESRNGKQGKLKDGLVSVKLLHNQMTVTEKRKMDKSFSCGKHLQMQLSTANPCVNLVLIIPCKLCLYMDCCQHVCLCVYASGNAVLLMFVCFRVRGHIDF